MKYNPLKKILILVTILAVPGFLYYLLQEKGKNRYKPLSIYGPKKIAGTFHSVRGKQIPDTIYHVVPNFRLSNQINQSISLDAYRSKVLLFNLIYTKDENKGIKFANKAVQAFNSTYEKNAMLHFISLSIDPVYDTPEILNRYAKQYNAVPGRWDFLTGDSSVVSKLIKNGLLLDAVKTLEEDQPKFVFNNMFVLLDSQHRIRGFYEATNQEALSKLDDEIKVLIAEELRNIRDGR